MNIILQTALTYYENRDKLIYSYRGNTFLQNGELYDLVHEGKGRIDCSTLVHLALQEICYEDSPYVSGDTDIFFGSVCKWQNAGSIEMLAAAANTIRDVYVGRSDRASDIRRAYGLAKYCKEQGLEIEGERKPGDLVFFEAPSSVYEEYVKYGAYMAISHVGIVTEDTEVMLNATGRSDQEYNALHAPIMLTPISEKGKPLLTARLLF